MSRIRIRVTLLAALAALAATATVAAGASAAVPSKVTALGDSITQAFQTCTQAFTDCPENSWATGTSSTVKSVFFRIKEKNSSATATNRSVTGAKVASLNEQAKKAVSDKPEFVTILIGANDACANPSTSQSSFSSSFQAAINTLEEGLPGVRIYVGSIPNLFHLWEIFHTNSTATGSWELTKECPGIMTEPTSEGTTAKNRRAATLAAEEGYDATMASICNATSNCQWDNGTFFKAQFVASEVSTNDYFHPSIAGQASLAAAAFSIASSCTAEGFCGSFTHTESREAPFGEPNALAVDKSANIWVTDSTHDHLIEFNSNREFVRQVGSEGTGNGQFKGIGGVVTDSSGDIFVSDSGNDRIQEFSSAGTFLKAFGSSAPGSGQLLSPGAVAIDASANVWVLNGTGAQEGGRIVEFSSSGTFVSQVGSKGSAGGQLLYPDGLAFSGGNLYVSEVSPHRVQELSTSGTFIASFDETGSSLPAGIATDPTTGNLYVTDVNGHVQQFSAAGSLFASFGSPGSGAGQLWSPQGVAVGSSGTIFVADTHNQRVQEWILP
jgi:DNA-binding beta-propeller fold protein YncE/lysophospholipase L1-like esterase